MIIGQFSESYPPTIDGVGIVMYNYCRELDRRGHRSIFIAPESHLNVGVVECETMLYNSMGLPKVPYRFGFPELLPEFWKDLKDIPFDIVHAHSPFFAGSAAKDLAKKKKIPLVATFHSKYYDDAYRVTHSKTLSKTLVKYILDFYDKCDEVWTVNDNTADVLRGYGFEGPIVIMPNGITPDEQDAAADISDLPIPEDRPILLFVGQQDYKKGTRQLIEACGLLKDRGEPFFLIMVGDGQDQHALKKLAKELGIEESVLFTGKIPQRGRLMSIYRRADLFVFPSVYDNAPIVVREAAQQKTPAILVADSGASENVIDGVNGFTCDGSAEGIARRIVEALPTAKEAGERASESLILTWPMIGDEIEKRYQNLIEMKKTEMEL